MDGKANAGETAGDNTFGFRAVSTADKQELVDAVFDKVAGRYDLMNDLMSAGMHRVWKDALVNWLSPPRATSLPYAVLDVAGGTGDIAFRIVGRSASAAVTVADINKEMLSVGEKRALERGLGGRISFVEANAEALPFENGCFDAVTIAFGIRNVPRIDVALGEMYRVLKPGGRLLCLEFSAVDVAVLDRLYEAYSFNVIPKVGGWVVGEEEPYRYLVESIRRFPNQARFAAMIERAGFARVAVRNLSGGIVALHSGWKI
ncbi:MAG TPA: bifunctional demethylmenaquinone methyltransferase/2-methoxy-6-polyprenyl-1,4-benzoquinol methylase UbiE [Bauldia sp.]|nr:bifunctional demethylmenaquinone methyltransferase/2-methoxy-6-polyprenyl-1,4-benzoquinol methylase UbiE [Bauldia sp.]